MANSMAEACWLRQLLVELHSPLLRATLVYCHNVSTIYLSTNPVRYKTLSMLRLIFTLSVNALPSGTFAYSM
jgi:hypothetical protein